MDSNKHPSLERGVEVNKILSLIGSALFLMLVLATNNAHANFESTDTSTTGMCPANHKMYYIGANPPTSTSTFPVTSQPLNWTAGNTTRTFTFNEPSGSKTFNINFPSILDRNNSQGTIPFYGAINGSTSSALNLVHDSTSTVTNHILNISINRSISKSGYKIQDLDSTTVTVNIGWWWPNYVQRTPYIEQVDVSANNGRLTFNSVFHTANNPAPNTSIVTGIKGKNCSDGECNIDASWGYKAANSILNLKHNNTLNETSGVHAIGYSDFYFCLAPPKLIIKKQLSATRVNDSDTKRDQFNIKVSGGTLNPDANNSPASFTTTGSGQTISNTSSLISLTPDTSYTITESVLNGINLGEMTNYDTSYTCTNATAGSTSIMPSGATSSFTLSNLNYGDEVTCTVTNTPKTYTFTGYVFNDNGGIQASDDTKQNVSSTFTGNQEYFNGVFDRSKELGVTAPGLQVRLTDCVGENGGTNIATSSLNPQPVSTNPLGQYQFNVQANVIAALKERKVCVVEMEPSGWEYSVDTTNNNRIVNLVTNIYNYKTEEGSRNLDFGEVKSDNTALVLKKYQYIHECNNLLDYTTINESSDPTAGFSMVSPNRAMSPGMCIAYKVEAYNRGHVTLANIKISDTLQSDSVKSVFHLPVPMGTPSTLFTSANNSAPMGVNGTIISNVFSLENTTATNTANRAILYFNTKYGTTVNPQ